MKLQLKPEELKQIAYLVGAEKSNLYHMLGYVLNLETGELRDQLNDYVNFEGIEAKVLTLLLSHYALADVAPKSGKLVKYGDLPGGHAYEKTFTLRAVQPVADAFGDIPAELVKVSKLLGGATLDFGDAAVDIPALHGVSLVYVLWAKNEFPAAVTILYDESASNYLPTEDLAVLAELTTSRLLKAQSKIKNKNETTKRGA